MATTVAGTKNSAKRNLLGNAGIRYVGLVTAFVGLVILLLGRNITSTILQIASIIFVLVGLLLFVGNLKKLIKDKKEKDVVLFLLIGVLCYLGEQYVPGISIMAISITATIFISMLILYSSKIVIVTSKFKRIFMTVFFSMFISSLILTLVHYFSNGALTGFVDSYGFTLVVSVLYTALASVMLFMDFERIRFAVNNRIDKKYEWVLALGLMITLIWLFVEVFKLILIVEQRDN